MNLRGRIPVEPLDDEQLVRVERVVVAGYADAMARGRAHGSRWYLPALAAAAAAAVVAAVLVWKLRPAHPPETAVAAAAVRVEAAADGSRVDLGDATIAVAPGGAFAVTRPDGGVLVALDRGRVDLAVASRKGRAPLIVRAGDVDVVVVGTRFSVERGDAVTVEVTEGVVRVERDGGEVRVAAGQRWSAPATIAAGTPMPPVTAIAVATSDHFTGGGGGTPGTIAGDDIEMSTDTGVPELHGHDTAVPTVTGKDHGAGTRPHGAHDDAGSGAGSGAGSDGAGSGKTLDLIPAVRREEVAEPMDIGKSGDEAIAEFQSKWLDKSAKTAKERLIAYYALAHLYHAQGKNRDALRWLDAYTTQGPNGPEIESVLWMKIQLQCKHPIDEACRTAAATYMHKFPSSTRAELALQLTNAIDQ